MKFSTMDIKDIKITMDMDNVSMNVFPDGTRQLMLQCTCIIPLFFIILYMYIYK